MRIGLPKDAAEIIARCWQSNPKSLADCVKAVALGKNQSADLELAIDNKRVSGYENISVQQRVNDEWSYRELEEE